MNEIKDIKEFSKLNLEKEKKKVNKQINIYTKQIKNNAEILKTNKLLLIEYEKYIKKLEEFERQL